MRSLFNPDNPVMRFIAKAAYSVYLNLLWFVCSLPVVTAGAATTALFYASMRMVRDDESVTYDLTRSFFHSFRQNLKQSTVIWLILLIVGGVLAADAYVVYHLVYESALWTVLAALLIGAAIVYLTVCMYIFPLLSQFNNSTGAMFKNALAMGLRYLFCTLLMAAVYFAMAYVTVNIFTPAIFFGMGFSAFLCSYLLVKVFPQEPASPAPEEA